MKLKDFITKESFIFSIICLGLFGSAIGVIFFSWNETFFETSKTINAEKVAQFGDFIGGVFGSVWALAGVFLFYKALTDQRQDFKNNKDALDLQVQALNQQITEFQLSRDEQILNRRVYEEQSKTLKAQQFESNFYSLLDVYINIKSNFNHDNYEFFKTIVSEISEKYDKSNDYTSHHDIFIEQYLKIHDENREKLSNYFRCLYRIIKIIDSSNFLTSQQKFFYAKILRAQLSDYELIIIAFNSHTYWGGKLKSHILNYNLLKHLPIFCKSEFNYFSRKQNDNKLLLFSDELEKFLMKHLGLFYDVQYDIDKIEESFSIFNVIVGIYFNDCIDIKIYCEDDIKRNGINISDEEFVAFLKQYFFEKTIVETYVDKNQVKITLSTTNTENKKEFNIQLESEKVIKLNRDKY